MTDEDLANFEKNMGMSIDCFLKGYKKKSYNRNNNTDSVLSKKVTKHVKVIRRPRRDSTSND